MRFMFLFLVITTTTMYSQSSQDSTNIKNTARDYIEGWYTADSTRMEKALHPNLAKRKVTSDSTIMEVSTSWMIHATGKGFGSSPSNKRYIDIKILDISNNMATVKIISNKFFDYVDMVNYNNQWKIVNVLWEYNGVGAEGSIDEAKKVGLAYVKSIYLPNSNTISEIFHPSAAIRRSVSITQCDEVTLTWLNQAITDGKWQIPTLTDSQYKITVLDRERQSTCMKVETPDGVEHHHLTYSNGKWKIINILWQRNSGNTGLGSNLQTPLLPNEFQLSCNRML